MFLILEEYGCLVDCNRIEGLFVQSQPGGLQSELHFHLKGGNRPITQKFGNNGDAQKAFQQLISQMPSKFKASEQDDSEPQEDSD